MPEKKPSKLNLKKPAKRPLTPEEAQRQLTETMGTFYSVVGDAAINISIALNQIANNSDQILIELSDMKDNFNRMGLKDGWIKEHEIIEREAEGDEPENEPKG